TVFDFGTLSEGAMIPGKFVFRNAGDAVLKVETPDPSCGCTLVTVKPDTLKPGEKGEIIFTLDLTDARGPQQKHITVPSNDPQQPTVKLVVKGEAKAVFEVGPELVMFASVAPGETLSETVRVKRLDGKKLLIAKVEPSRDFL